MDSTIEDKLKQAESMLDIFEAGHNLAQPRMPSRIDEIFDLTYEQLEKLQPVQCAEYSYLLSQYAYYIQRAYNRESTSLKWIQDQIATHVAAKWSNYDGWTKYEVRPRLIARDNEVVNRLLKLASFYEQKMERLNFIGSSVSKMADKLDNLQRAKSYQNK